VSEARRYPRCDGFCISAAPIPPLSLKLHVSSGCGASGVEGRSASGRRHQTLDELMRLAAAICLPHATRVSAPCETPLLCALRARAERGRWPHEPCHPLTALCRAIAAPACPRIRVFLSSTVYFRRRLPTAIFPPPSRHRHHAYQSGMPLSPTQLPTRSP